MNEPTDPEKQLRDILKAHAVDSVHLLDEVLADAHRSREHAKQWYAERLERLKQMAKERGFWPEMAAILANGTATTHEPPTYAQLLNRAKHRAELAEEALSALREAVGPWVAVARDALARVDAMRAASPTVSSMSVDAHIRPTETQVRALIAAHDAAPSAPADPVVAPDGLGYFCAYSPKCTNKRRPRSTVCEEHRAPPSEVCAVQPAAPMLTLEEVEADSKQRDIVARVQKVLSEKGGGREPT